MATKLSATQLAKNLSDILSRARYNGERFVIERNGEPVASIEPPPKVGITLEELASLINDLPPIDERFADDLDTARSILRDLDIPRWPKY